MTNAENSRQAQLQSLARETLEALMLERCGLDEGFALWLDARMASRRNTDERIDPVPFRRQAEAILIAADTGYRQDHEWRTDVDEAELDNLIATAEPMLANGRGTDALAILTSVGSALVDYWPQVAHWDESLHELFPQIDRLLAHAVLLEDVTQEMRDELVDELEGWQDEIDDFGFGDAFSVAIAACERGWSESGLSEILSGQQQSASPASGDLCLENALAQARLAALDAMGQTAAYLNLSRAKRLDGEHAIKLARVNRIDDAITYARTHLSTPTDILALVEVVAAVGHDASARDLAAWGLSLAAAADDGLGWGPRTGKLELARWLREAAKVAEQREVMLMAARVTFEESLSQEDFAIASRLAGPADWPKLREILLAALLAAPYASERLDILIDEELISEATSLVDPHERTYGRHDSDTLIRLAEAAYADYPDWAIALGLDIADSIMNDGKASQYEAATEWLAIVARAHAADRRSGEWNRHLEELIEKHRRKYKLRPMLEALRSAPLL